MQTHVDAADEEPPARELVTLCAQWHLQIPADLDEGGWPEDTAKHCHLQCIGLGDIFVVQSNSEL